MQYITDFFLNKYFEKAMYIVFYLLEEKKSAKLVRSLFSISTHKSLCCQMQQKKTCNENKLQNAMKKQPAKLKQAYCKTR